METIPKHTPILFIGAGPTTIGACYRLRDLKYEDYFVIEAGDQFGGLSRSYLDDKGFTWDLGGHVQFSHYKEFDNAMDEALETEGWLHHQRESWVWIQDQFVPYPFQYNFHLLSKDTIHNCLEGLKNRSNERNPNHFKDWLHQQFGTGLCDLFMFPYNFKVWAHPPELMNHEWISERVATVDISRIEENIKTYKLDVSWGPNATFRFPSVGGTGQIWKNLGKKIIQNRVSFNTKVVNISAKFKVATLSNGQQISFDKIFSTMPIDKLCKMIEDEDFAKVAQQSKSLPHSSTHVIGIGLKGQPSKELAGKCWMYFPEDHSPYYRITLFSQYSPKNVPNPDDNFSLMLEVSESPHKPVSKSLIEECINALLKDKLIESKEQIVSKWSTRLEYGYPVPGLGRTEIIKDCHEKLQSYDIYSRGRFGHWHYEVSNQDHSFMQGHEWVDMIFNHKKEVTLWNK